MPKTAKPAQTKTETQPTALERPSSAALCCIPVRALLHLLPAQTPFLTLARASQPCGEERWTLNAQQTLAAYLEAWLLHKATGVRISTLERYRKVIDNHILPTLGQERLDMLRPRHVDILHKTIQAKGLSHRMVEFAHVALHSVLDYAVRLELLSRNVTDSVKLPRKTEFKELYP